MSHWYQKDGTAMHTMAGTNGEQRATTLRDARKLGLVPSVTTIIKEGNPGPILQNWITDQALLSALNHPGGIPSRLVGRPGASAVNADTDGVRDFLKWCREDSRKQVTDKAELGSAIHDALNKSFVDPDEVPAHFLAHVDGARKILADQFGDERVWHPERSHACGEGFGGSIDLESEEPFMLDGVTYEGLLLDFKCKEYGADKEPKSMVFDEHFMQLGGYSIMRKKPRALCGNVFVSTQVPGLARLVLHKAEDIERGRQMFLALNSYWRAKNKYTP